MNITEKHFPNCFTSSFWGIQFCIHWGTQMLQIYLCIVYCRGNRDAVLIKTIHAWPLIWRHLCKCNLANNYHLDGLYVVMDILRWHCIFFSLILFLSVAPSLTRHPGSGELVVKKGSTVSLKCQATGFPSPKVLFWQKTYFFDKKKQNWMKGDQGH